MSGGRPGVNIRAGPHPSEQVSNHILMTIAIIGAGLAGLSCATALEAAGHDVTLFDKGRAPGGRMSTRRIETTAGTASFDHGAQYFTVRDPAFRAETARWQAAGLAAPWPAAGPDAWVGTPGMTAPVRTLAKPLTVHCPVQIDAIGHADAAWTIGGLAFDNPRFADADGAELVYPGDSVLRFTTSANGWAVDPAADELRITCAADALYKLTLVGVSSKLSAPAAALHPAIVGIPRVGRGPQLHGRRLERRAGVRLPVAARRLAHRERQGRDLHARRR